MNDERLLELHRVATEALENTPGMRRAIGAAEEASRRFLEDLGIDGDWLRSIGLEVVLADRQKRMTRRRVGRMAFRRRWRTGDANRTG